MTRDITVGIFTKYAWVIPLKNKTGEQIAQAFLEIFKLKRIPKKIQTDQGLEFYNSKVLRLFEDKGIKLFSSYSELKASVVERFNRTIKEKWEIFSMQNNHVWFDVLDEVAKHYNTSFHRSIKMSPIEASLKKNKEVIRNILYPSSKCYKKTKFKVGDTVRLRKYKGILEKGHKQNYKSEVFEIKEVFSDGVPYYHLVDMKGEDILGTTYEQDMVLYLCS